ncbi:MAG: paraquat-inducible protein A, partial [Pseudomonadota bacterium]
LAIPALHAGLILYTLLPIALDRTPWPGARMAFRTAQQLRPWAMAEIFAIGCAVSLVKITDMAAVSFGPAFWMFAALVILVVIQQRLICTWSIWNALATGRRF